MPLARSWLRRSGEVSISSATSPAATWIEARVRRFLGLAGSQAPQSPRPSGPPSIGTPSDPPQPRIVTRIGYNHAQFVVPAKAGTQAAVPPEQCFVCRAGGDMGPRFRGDDKVVLERIALTLAAEPSRTSERNFPW